MSAIGEVLEALVEAGHRGMSTTELREALPHIGVSTLQQAVVTLRNRRATSGIVRLGRAVYAYRPDRLTDDVPPGMGDGSGEREPNVLDAVAAGIPPEAFQAAGLTIAGLTAAGDRLAIDEHGTAWIIEVQITGRLI